MELVLSGVAVQLLALALLAVLAIGHPGELLRLRSRLDGRQEQVPDEAAAARRRLMLRGLIGLFLGGTMLALTGLPEL